MPESLNEVLAYEATRDRPSSHDQVVDTKLLEQERRTRELEARVAQLEMIARARGLIPPIGSGGRNEHPAAPQAS